MIHAVKSILGLTEDPYDIGCRAVRDDGTICENEPIGRSGDGRIEYCDRHVPSEASTYGRIGSVEFYIPEEDKLIQKD